MKRKYEEEFPDFGLKKPDHVSDLRTRDLLEGCQLEWHVGSDTLHKHYGKQDNLFYNDKSHFLLAVMASMAAKERMLRTPYFTNALDIEDMFFYSWLVEQETCNFAPKPYDPLLREMVKQLYSSDGNLGLSTSTVFKYIKKNNPFFECGQQDESDESVWRPKNIKTWLTFIKDSFAWIDVVCYTNQEGCFKPLNVLKLYFTRINI